MINGQIYRDQTAYELALPPDQPETPDMSNEVDALMIGVDTVLVSYEAFKRCADEELYDLVPDGFCVELILAASRSSDPAMKLMAKAARKALEEHAGTMLDAAWEKEQGRDRSNDF
ncbi:MAG: hypothetical protein VYD45_11365 [Pseudomonadota bacterium]|nr:hypothetical protein [Pseudomonadota bacterium]